MLYHSNQRQTAAGRCCRLNREFNVLSSSLFLSCWLPGKGLIIKIIDWSLNYTPAKRQNFVTHHFFIYSLTTVHVDHRNWCRAWLRFVYFLHMRAETKHSKKSEEGCFSFIHTLLGWRGQKRSRYGPSMNRKQRYKENFTHFTGLIPAPQNPSNTTDHFCHKPNTNNI